MRLGTPEKPVLVTKKNVLKLIRHVGRYLKQLD